MACYFACGGQRGFFTCLEELMLAGGVVEMINRFRTFRSSRR